MQTLHIGISIVANRNTLSLLYYNPAMKDLVQKLTERSQLPDCEKDFLENCLKGFRIKPSVACLPPKSFQDLLEETEGCCSSESSHFLDHPSRLVELRVSNVTFDNQDCKLVSFIDCTSARDLQKAQMESKYKTMFIASTSHELRTPVMAILGILEVIEQYVPRDSSKLLDIAKESCNMITFHINDLTVIIFHPPNLTKTGLWEAVRVKNSGYPAATFLEAYYRFLLKPREIHS